MITATEEWLNLLSELVRPSTSEVSPVSAGANWKGRASKELLAYRTTVHMTAPVIESSARNLGLKFLVAECAWVASGDNRVSTIAPFSRMIPEFSDDGVRFFGAYGPRFIDQLSYATACLRKDPVSRQAVINVWREQPRASKDTPCTLSWQYLIRGGYLNCVATMRSSDAWTGLVFDWPVFSTCAAVLAIELRDAYPRLQLGELHVTAGSQHLYLSDEAPARLALAKGKQPVSYAPLNLAEFASSDELIAHLWALARGEQTEKRWLKELFV